MPFARCVFSGDSSVKDTLAINISSVVAKSLGKPEDYMVVEVSYSDSLYFGGSKDPSAMIQIESIGGDLPSVADALGRLSATIGRWQGLHLDRTLNDI